MSVTLSTGEVVHFKEKFTHGADRAWGIAFTEGIYRQDGVEGLGKVPVRNLALAYEACIPYIIQKIESNGIERKCDQAWLEELTPKDYDKIDQVAHTMKMESVSGKKKD